MNIVHIRGRYLKEKGEGQHKSKNDIVLIVIPDNNPDMQPAQCTWVLRTGPHFRR